MEPHFTALQAELNGLEVQSKEGTHVGVGFPGGARGKNRARYNGETGLDPESRRSLRR